MIKITIQAFLNLITNAINHLPHGEECIIAWIIFSLFTAIKKYKSQRNHIHAFSSECIY